MREPARLTVTDLVYVLLALVGLSLWPVVDSVITAAAPRLANEQELIYTTMLPMAVLVLLAVIYVEARGGLR
jgi:ABC-type polysaccharide/polyol phosphate export permease